MNNSDQGNVKRMLLNQGNAEITADARHDKSEHNANKRQLDSDKISNTRQTSWSMKYYLGILFLMAVSIICTWMSTNYWTHYHGNAMYNDDSSVNLMEAIKQQETLIYKLSNQVQERTLKKIWFDRKREHSNLGFAIIDEKFPAGYEVWDGKKLIERWHWKIKGNPKTDQFKEYIFRCVAVYNKDDEYTGYTQTIMDHYPTEMAGELGMFKNNPKPKTLSYTLNLKKQNFVLESKTMGIEWKDGIIYNSYKLEEGFKYDNGKADPLSIIETNENYNYLVHLSLTFPFIKNQLVEPYDNKLKIRDVERGINSYENNVKNELVKAGVFIN